MLNQRIESFLFHLKQQTPMTFGEGKQRDARKTVLGPEEQEEPDRYEKREGLAAQDPMKILLSSDKWSGNTRTERGILTYRGV